LLCDEFPTDNVYFTANTLISAVLLRRLSLRTNHNSPIWAQTDDLLKRYARKTGEICLSFSVKEALSVGNLHVVCSV
jgi:hypothetical protein